jgi:hypothetical protein
MIIRNKREGKYITDLERKTARGIARQFINMSESLDGVAKIVFGKTQGSSPVDLLVDLGFEKIQDVIEDGVITAYAFGYQQVANGTRFEVNLERVNKQALEMVEKRKEFTNAMKQYTKEKLYQSLEKALRGDITYEEYIAEARNIFVLSENRAEKIAMNEIGTVYVEGTLKAVKDYEIKLGVKVLKSWNTVNDSRVTEGCKHNESLGYVDSNYIYPDIDGLGGGDAPPRFIGCRCALDYDVVDIE